MSCCAERMAAIFTVCLAVVRQLQMATKLYNCYAFMVILLKSSVIYNVKLAMPMRKSLQFAEWVTCWSVLHYHWYFYCYCCYYFPLRHIFFASHSIRKDVKIHWDIVEKQNSCDWFIVLLAVNFFAIHFFPHFLL